MSATEREREREGERGREREREGCLQLRERGREREREGGRGVDSPVPNSVSFPWNVYFT